MDLPTACAFGRRAVRELTQAALDAVCPPHCPACGGPAEGLCAVCVAALQRNAPPVCPRCGEPRPPGSACQGDHRRLAGLLFRRVPLRYAGTGGALVRRVKFASDDAAAALLARSMADALRAWGRSAGRRAVLVSVPLHRRKQRQRGVDQAAVLGELVAIRLGLRYQSRVLVRLRETLPQGDPRVTSRAANVAGAFAVRRRMPVRGRTVILVDDVTTSGSTARECARVLRAAGARAVVLLAAAG